MGIYPYLVYGEKKKRFLFLRVNKERCRGHCLEPSKKGWTLMKRCYISGNVMLWILPAMGNTCHQLGDAFLDANLCVTILCTIFFSLFSLYLCMEVY